MLAQTPTQPQPQQQQALGGILGNIDKFLPIMLGVSLLQSGRGGGGPAGGALLGSLGGVLNYLQSKQQGDLAMKRFEQNMAMQKANLAIARDQLGVSRGNLGVSRGRLGLDREKFDQQRTLQDQQSQRYQQAIEELRGLLGTPGDQAAETPGTGYLGGKLTADQLRASAAIPLLMSGNTGAVAGLLPQSQQSQQQTPTSLQRNLAAAGLEPGSPEFKEAVLQSISKPSSRLTVNMSKNMNKADVKKIERADERAEIAADNLSKIRQFKSAVELYPTGFFGRATLKARQVDQALGGLVSDPKVTAAGELIRSFGTEFMLQFVQRTKGSISEPENRMFLEASPGLSLTKEGNLNISNAMEATNQRLYEKAEFTRSYINANGTAAGLEKNWQKYVTENPILSMKDGMFVINKENIDNWESYVQKGGSQSERRQAVGATADPLGIR